MFKSRFRTYCGVLAVTAGLFILYVALNQSERQVETSSQSNTLHLRQTPDLGK